MQVIKRKNSEQWYVNFPSVLAQAVELLKGETVEWFVEGKELLGLRKPEAPERLLKKLLWKIDFRLSSDCLIGRTH